jgi:hypothetical protein
MNIADDIRLVCCFCGNTVELDAATKIVVSSPRDDGAEQVLYCHGQHLRSAIIEDIVLLEGIADEGDAQNR